MFVRSVFAVLFALMTANVYAQDFVLSTWLKSQYLGANGAIFESQPVVQSELSVTKENCWASVWLSTAGDDWKVRGGDELDYNASCGWKLGSTTVSLLVAYYDLAAEGGASDVTVSVDRGSYYGKFSTYGTHGGLPFPGGQIARVGRKFDLGGFREWEFAASTELAYDFGSFGFQEGFFGKMSFSGIKTLSGNTKVSLGVDFSDGITVSDRHGEVATWIGVSRSF